MIEQKELVTDGQEDIAEAEFYQPDELAAGEDYDSAKNVWDGKKLVTQAEYEDQLMKDYQKNHAEQA